MYLRCKLIGFDTANGARSAILVQIDRGGAEVDSCWHYALPESLVAGAAVVREREEDAKAVDSSDGAKPGSA